ncbi:restriction endonuclease subunit S [Pseudomonas kunmingensis]|uniref:restriction endonuclease subunit S n=1 Tax=Stutzerimonas kunmingensis TaxID=1211807 RepID=UPI0015E2B947|nr:restriction endonuclease subunit S [Stutzerimonas kunmingensis]MBA1236987.1 restriction endonuclease subunit S [Stutzerimonas kunmingensis]
MSWPEVVFESVFAAPSRNGVYKSKEHHGSGVPIVNMGELFAFDRIGEQATSLLQMTDAELEKSGLIDGDLLFGRRSLVEEGAGKCSMVYRPSRLMTFESSIIRVRLDKTVADPEFFFNYFRSPIGRSRVRAIVGGAAVKGIRGSDLKLIKVHLPPINEQIAIRQVVSAYDDLIATNQRRITLLEDAARRLYREWFVQFRFPGHESVLLLDGVPQGWQSGSAFDFVSIMSGGTPKTGMEHFWGGEIPFFTPKDSPDAFYVLGTEKTLTESGLASCNSRLFPKDTVFITARGTVGKIALAQKPMAMNQSCYALAPKQDYDNRFLFLAIQEAVDHFKQVATGGVFNAIIVDTFKIIPFLMPDIWLTRVFGDKVQPIFQQIENLLLQNQNLARARDLLLPKLMSGQLDVSGIPLPDEVAA